MPPPRNEQDVRRITKQLAHPRDRKVRQLEKRQARADRVSAQEAKRKQEKERLLLRMIWFREQCIALGYTKAAVPRALWMPLVRLFMARNEAEVASLKAMRNPPVGRIRLLEGLADEEKAELQSTRGFEIPALGEDDDVEILTEVWDCLLETSVVLEKAYVTARDASPEDAAVMAELAAKLKPIDEVRKDAEAVLPRRAQKFREKRRTSGAGAGLTRKDRGSGKVAADNKTSVKRLAAASGAEQRERVKETAHRKQQTAQKKHREALLESRRNAISE